MEIDRESDIVESNSLEEIESCSSSILDTPNREDMYVDDDDYDDGINVTILSSSATLEFNKKAVENSMVEKKLNASATSNSNGNTENNSGNPLVQTPKIRSISVLTELLRRGLSTLLTMGTVETKHVFWRKNLSEFWNLIHISVAEMPT